jgi:hypothetical protein
MARTPKRLAGPAQVSNAAATKYTVPANTKAVIRHIHISNPSGSAVDFTLSIGADAAGLRLFDAMPIAADSVYDYFCRHTLEETEVVQAFAGTNNVITLTIDGDEYTLG